MSAPGDWILDAACAGLPTGMFYPLPGDHKTPERAKRICARCPVRPECADYGRDERFGIWGGETPRERNKRFRTSGDPVPAVGSQRRLRALASLGYGPHAIANEAVELGIELLSRDTVRYIRQDAKNTDYLRAAAIAELYDHLVARGHYGGRSALFARRQAVREEWPPPPCWIGRDIDDPKAQPWPLRIAA